MTRKKGLLCMRDPVWYIGLAFSLLTMISGCTLGHRSAVRDDAIAPKVADALSLAQEHYRAGRSAMTKNRWDRARTELEQALSLLSMAEFRAIPHSTALERRVLRVEVQMALDELAALTPTTVVTRVAVVQDTTSADSTVTPGLAQLLDAEPSTIVTDTTTTAKDVDIVKILESTLDFSAFDLPVVLNERVEAAFQFLRNFKKFREWLNRSNRYVPMMRAIFQKEGLPGDLVYLSLIESGHHPRAYSRAKAAGLWQFIPSTGRERGLKQTAWIDDRFDPEKATQAAARHFKQLYQMFGDWQLVMAAHNGGPGLIQKIIRKKGITDYWRMKLPKETMQFVPLIMAAAIISKNPVRYGFDVQSESSLAYETVSVDRSYTLKTISQGMNVPLDDLKMLNPELRKWQLPPGGYSLKIPVGTQPAFMAWASTPETAPADRDLTSYTVRSGDSILSIARRYGVSAQTIISENSLTHPNRLSVGQSLLIPGVESDGSVALTTSTPDSQAITYTVKRGDTLWRIARQFNVTVDSVRIENRLTHHAAIHPGDRLKISVQRGEIRQSGQ